VNTPPVFGDFLRSAGDHITAAVSYRSELPYTAQLGAIRHLDRLIAALARYLTDLPGQPHLANRPERDGSQRAIAALLALDRVTQNLRPAAATAAVTGTAHAHPAANHLAAAADHLTAGRDLLHTHFTTDPAGIISAKSYWAPLIISGPVTAALLAELAGYLHTLTPWIAAQARTRRAVPGTLTAAHLALRAPSHGSKPQPPPSRPPSTPTTRSPTADCSTPSPPTHHQYASHPPPANRFTSSASASPLPPSGSAMLPSPSLRALAGRPPPPPRPGAVTPSPQP
jgi:hypothetical protein